MRIILFILGVFLISSCQSEYLDHIERTHTEIVSASGDIATLSGELYVLPDVGVLSSLVEDIESAKSRIWLETYTWTEKSTQEAILRAKSRGVDVRVILEGNVYNTPWINIDITKKLQSANVIFRYADNKKYTFTHIKTWIIDDRVCVSTGNWSYTSFTKNREFIYCTSDAAILEDISEIFLSDFHGINPYFSGGLHPQIGLAPDHIRPWIEGLLSRAKKRIIIYNQSVTDDKLLLFLEQRSHEGIQIFICSAAHEEDVSSGQKNRDTIWFLTSEKPYLHAKVFLIDDAEIILGSANMTQNALENNREILLNIGQNKALFDRIYSFYHKDCHSSPINALK